MRNIIDKINEFLNNKKLVATILIICGIVVAVYIGIGIMVEPEQAEEPKVEYEDDDYNLSGDEGQTAADDEAIAEFGDDIAPKNASDYNAMSKFAWRSGNDFIVFHPDELRAHQYSYKVSEPQTESDVENYGYYDVMLAENIMALAGVNGGHIEGEYALNGDTLTFKGKTYTAYPLENLLYFSFDMYGVGF